MSTTHLIATSVLGSGEGTAFNDFAPPLGGFVPPVNLTIDVSHPISQIIIQAGHLVDGFQVTYNLAAGGTTVLSHGTAVNAGAKNTTTIDLSPTENIVGVSGKSGYADYAVYALSFCILDSATSNLRVVGPLGKQKNGDPFHFSGTLLAFAGTENAGADDTGLCSIAFTLLQQ